MSRSRWGLCAVVLLLMAATTAPSTDQSSPKAAAKMLWSAVAAGDAEIIQQVLHSDNDSQRELTAAFANLLVSGKKLGDAAREKFGPKADPIARPMIDPKDYSKIDSADVKQDGNSAALTLAGGGKPIALRKTGDRWRVVVTDFANALPENIPRQLKLLKTMSQSLEESAKEIQQGKYATAAAAEAVIQQRLHTVMIDSYRPASGPSSAPTTHASQQR